jgi:hypothetical protein
MGLAGEIRDAFAGVNQSGLAAEALIAEVEAAMERMPEDQLAAVLARLGFEVAQKRQAAQVIAAARQVLAEVGPLLALLA